MCKANDKRIDYIDTDKGIAIILVVLQHAGISISNYIMSFHMPFFFLIYGYTLDDKHLVNAGSLKKKVQAYIVPYFVWAFIYLRKFNIDAYKSILWGTSNVLRPVSQGILWFLPAFFIAVVIYRAIMSFIIASKQNKYLLLGASLLVFGIMGACLNYNNVPEEGLWFGCNISGGGIVFMICGYLLRKAFDAIIISPNAKWKRYLLSSLVAIIGILLIPIHKMNTPVIMGVANYGKYSLYLFNAISQSILLICISYIINNKVIQYIGKNTMIIYLIHPLLLNIFAELGIVFSDINMNGICCCAFSIIIGLLLAQIVNRYCPWLIGKAALK